MQINCAIRGYPSNWLAWESPSCQLLLWFLLWCWSTIISILLTMCFTVVRLAPIIIFSHQVLLIWLLWRSERRRDCLVFIWRSVNISLIFSCTSQWFCRSTRLIKTNISTLRLVYRLLGHDPCLQSVKWTCHKTFWNAFEKWAFEFIFFLWLKNFG